MNRWAGGPGGASGAGGPADLFRALDLRPAQDLTDDDVRAAWRRIASATHPDREDGGAPARFAAAAAAYTALRTRSGRGEVLADLAAGSGRAAATGGLGLVLRRISGRYPGGTVRLPRRVRQGRPGRLALRAAAALIVSAIAVAAAGPHPAAPALVAGVLTWFLLTARHDLAPPGD